MDEQRFQEIKDIQDKMLQGMNYHQAAGANSGMNVPQTVGFLGKVQKYEDDWKLPKAVYNGFVIPIARGIVGTLQMARDKNIKIHKEQDPNYKPEDTAGVLDDIAQSEALKRYNIIGDNAVSQFGLDLAEGAGQLAGQIGVTALTGGIGGAAFMGAQIAGGQYMDLREQGVDSDRAAAASLTNMIIQTPMEQLSVGKILGKVPGGSSLKRKGMKVLESMLTEGATEFAQEFPEQMTNIYALNENANDARSIAREWDKNAGENIKSALYSGAIGAVLGGAGNGAVVAAHSVRDYVANKRVENEVESFNSEVEKLKKSGVTPEYAKQAVAAANPSGTALISGARLYQYAQKKGPEKVTEALKVTTEELSDAAANGYDVEVMRSDLAGAALQFGDLLTAVKDDMVFAPGDKSINDAMLQKDLRKEYELGDDAAADLDAEIDKVMQTAEAAAVPKATMNAVRQVLMSRAMRANPENPGQYFRDHPLEISRVVHTGNGNRYFQYKNAQERIASDTKNFVESVDAFNKGTIKDDTIRVMRTPVVMELVGAKILPVDISVATMEKVLKKKHGDDIDADILKQLPEKLTDPLMIFDTYSGENGEVRKVAVVDLKTKNGATIVVPFELEADNKSKSYVMNEILSAYGKTDRKTGAPSYKWIEKQLKDGRLQYVNRKRAVDYLNNEKLYSLMPYLNSNGSSTNIIADEETLRKKRAEAGSFYQENNKTPKGAIDWDGEGTAIINLFKGADASTVFHELGHYFIENMADDVNSGRATAQEAADWETVLKRMGMTNAQWLAADIDGRRAGHERLAEDFETYLMEGKAPSMALRNVFKKIKAWMLKAYESISRSENYVPLTDDVRQVFDRMLASENEIAAIARVDGYFNKLPSVITDNLNNKSKEKLANYILAAKDKAVEILTKESLANFTKERRERINKYKSEIRPHMEEMVAQQPLYAAAADIVEFASIKRNSAKTIARRYLNEDGRMYNDWQEELNAVQADISERLQPIIDSLNDGMGNGIAIIRNDETGNYTRHSNNALWYRRWYKENGRRPSNKQLEDLARDIYSGHNEYGLDGWPPATNAEEQAEYDANKADIDELMERRQELLDFKESVKPFKHKGLSAEDRLTFEEIAEAYQFSSADELAQKIMGASTYERAVRNAINEAASVEFPDIYAEREAAENAAREAMYNDDSGLLLGVEQQLIEEMAAGLNAKQQSDTARQKLAQARKEQAAVAAKEEINAMTLKAALQTRRFVTAERRAAAQAAKAVKAKDWEAAADYKRQQALNHALVRESLIMRQRVEASKRFLKRQNRQKREAWGKTDGAFKHFNQAAALLARMGIVRRDYDPKLKDQTLAQYVTDMNQLIGGADIAPWLLDESAPLDNPYGMTYAEYMDVIDALKNIRALAKVQEGTNVLGSQKDYLAKRTELMDSIAGRADYERIAPGERNKLKLLEGYMGSLMNADNLFLAFDGWKDGGTWMKLFTNIKHCWDKEGAASLELDRKRSEALKELLPTWEDRMTAEKKIYCPELGMDNKGKGVSMNRFQLIQILLNLGNDSSAKRLCETPPVGLENCPLWVRPNENVNREQAAAMTQENLIELLGKYLTEADVRYADRMIEIAEAHYDEKRELDIKTKGFPPDKVEATPVALTLGSGKVVLFKGGYYPLVRDTSMGSHVAGQDALPGTEAETGNNTLFTNSSSHKNRNDMAAYPVDITPEAGWRSIRESLHDLYFRETMRDWNRLLKDEEMYSMMARKFGSTNMKLLTEMLRATARPWSSTQMTAAEKELDRMTGWLRRKTINAAIMLSFKPWIQNLTNIFLFGNAVDGFTQADTAAAMMTAVRKMVSEPRQLKADYAFVMANSVAMRERATMPDISVRQVVEEGKQGYIEQQVMKFGGMMLWSTDMLTAVPVWTQAYGKKMNEGASHQDAVDYADSIIRRTLGGNRVSDVASMQRAGGAYRLLTMFQGFFMTQFNQWARETHIDKQLIDSGKYKEAAIRMAGFLAAKYVAVCLFSLALVGTNPAGDDDDDGWMDINQELVNYPLSLGGPAGQMSSYLLKSMLDMKNYSYRMSAAQSTIERYSRAAAAASKLPTWARGDDDTPLAELVEPITGAAAMTVGVPNQLGTWFWNAFDLFYNDDMELRVEDFFRRRPKRERNE